MGDRRIKKYYSVKCYLLGINGDIKTRRTSFLNFPDTVCNCSPYLLIIKSIKDFF